MGACQGIKRKEYKAQHSTYRLNPATNSQDLKKFLDKITVPSRRQHLEQKFLNSSIGNLELLFFQSEEKLKKTLELNFLEMKILGDQKIEFLLKTGDITTKFEIKEAKHDQIKVDNIKSFQLQNPKVKVLCVIGFSGHGKSTFINCIANYLYGIQKPEEDVRYRLFEVHNNGESQTKQTIGYYLKENKYEDQGYLIIDTPGLNDTTGSDEQGLNDVCKYLFEMEFIDQFLLLNNGFQIMGVSEKHTILQLLKIFGNNCAKSFTQIFTFSDFVAPKLDLYTESGIFKKIYDKEGTLPYSQFQNAVMFQTPKLDCIQQFYFKNTIDNYGKLFEKLKKIDIKQRQTMEEVRININSRGNILKSINRIKIYVNHQLIRIHEKQQLESKLNQLENKILQTSNFKYTTYEQEIKFSTSKDGFHVTNCTICQTTCHDECYYSGENERKNCIIMEKGRCTKCKHNHDVHKNTNQIITCTYVAKEKEWQDIKDQHHRGLSDKEIILAEKNYIKVQLAEYEQSVMQMLFKIEFEDQKLKENMLYYSSEDYNVQDIMLNHYISKLNTQVGIDSQIILTIKKLYEDQSVTANQQTQSLDYILKKLTQQQKDLQEKQLQAEELRSRIADQQNNGPQQDITNTAINSFEFHSIQKVFIQSKRNLYCKINKRICHLDCRLESYFTPENMQNNKFQCQESNPQQHGKCNCGNNLFEDHAYEDYYEYIITNQIILLESKEAQQENQKSKPSKQLDELIATNNANLTTIKTYLNILTVHI